LENLHDVVLIIAITGMRLGELRNHCWADIDFPWSRVAVTTKNIREHCVPFGMRARPALEALHGRRPTSAFVLGDFPQGFTNRVSRQLQVVGEHLGIRPASFHALRGPFSMRFMLSNPSTSTLKLILGHRECDSVSFISSHDERFECAARDQARVEEDL
jgi:integrase